MNRREDPTAFAYLERRYHRVTPAQLDALAATIGPKARNPGAVLHALARAAHEASDDTAAAAGYASRPPTAAENPDDRGSLPGDALVASPDAAWEDVEAPRCAALRTIDAGLGEPAVSGDRMRELIAQAPWANDYARYRETGRVPSSLAPKPRLYPAGVEGHDDGCPCEECIAARERHWAERRATPTHREQVANALALAAPDNHDTNSKAEAEA